jgi:mRNA interferase RelE/StbE
MTNQPAGSPKAYVRLTDPAVNDLRQLLRKDPQIVRWALKKMLLLERDPNAGEPLLGQLIGWRKLVVGDRDWRIVWRRTSDDTGTTTITIAEVWAVGARGDAEVYAEMNDRVAAVEQTPSTIALAEIVKLLGRHTASVIAADEPQDDPVPFWLRDRLLRSVGLDSDDVDAMTGEAAMRRWERYMTIGE